MAFGGSMHDALAALCYGVCGEGVGGCWKFQSSANFFTIQDRMTIVCENTTFFAYSNHVMINYDVYSEKDRDGSDDLEVNTHL